MSILQPAIAANELLVHSGPGTFGALTWDELQLEYGFAAGAETGWQLSIDGVAVRFDQAEAALGRVVLTCDVGTLRQRWPECTRGGFQWHPDGAAALAGRFYVSAEQGGRIRLALDDPELEATLVLDEHGLSATLDVRHFPLALLEGVASHWLSRLDGTLSGVARYDPAAQDKIRFRGELSALDFDTPAGFYAAEGVAANMDVELALGELGWQFQATLVQSAGELLLGPVYVPEPEQPVRIETAGRLHEESLQVTRLEIEEPEVLSASLALTLKLGAEIHLVDANLHALEMHLPAAQTRYLDGLLAEFSLHDLTTDGILIAAGRIDEDGVDSLDVMLAGLVAEDARQRFGIRGLNGGLRWRRETGDLQLDLDWFSGNIHAIPVGSARLRLSSDGEHLRLEQPLSIPVFDGALRIDQLHWWRWRGEGAQLDLDAHLEPLDFASLSTAMGWPALGGRVSGSIPQVSFADDVLAFGGGVEIQAFSGHITVRELSVERPFGSLPGLTAEIEFDALNLREVTGAFGFGRMEGLLSGHIRRLRMLDWQPVAFTAGLFTVEERGIRQRISQRAVDHLSSLGGGGGALTAPLLRFFEDFPYRRAGLTCQLANNVCHMGGVGDTDDGGFIIVEGRGIPRLNINGYRRLVDWPQLVRQLQAVTASETSPDHENVDD